LTTLKLVGTRGAFIAFFGSILPICLGVCIAYALGYHGIAAIAAGCTFAPTSHGIIMGVLKKNNVINTPTGQLILAAAILDDMIACE